MNYTIKIDENNYEELIDLLYEINIEDVNWKFIEAFQKSE